MTTSTGTHDDAPEAQVQLLDADGILLSTAACARAPSASYLVLWDVDDAEALLNYVFGRGEHEVIAELPDRRLVGSLETHWESNGRAWHVELGEALRLSTLLAGEPEHAR
ncbi:MAG: hypothetical protein U0821_27930 [Chloroflexota bacterium]